MSIENFFPDFIVLFSDSLYNTFNWIIRSPKKNFKYFNLIIIIVNIIENKFIKERVIEGKINLWFLFLEFNCKIFIGTIIDIIVDKVLIIYNINPNSFLRDNSRKIFSVITVKLLEKPNKNLYIINVLYEFMKIKLKLNIDKKNKDISINILDEEYFFR